jgi:hypothetical protein
LGTPSTYTHCYHHCSSLAVCFPQQPHTCLSGAGPCWSPACLALGATALSAVGYAVCMLMSYLSMGSDLPEAHSSTSIRISVHFVLSSILDMMTWGSTCRRESWETHGQAHATAHPGCWVTLDCCCSVPGSAPLASPADCPAAARRPPSPSCCEATAAWLRMQPCALRWRHCAQCSPAPATHQHDAAQPLYVAGGPTFTLSAGQQSCRPIPGPRRQSQEPPQLAAGVSLMTGTGGLLPASLSSSLLPEWLVGRPC